MILYVDSSALVKFYIQERGSADVLETYEKAQQAATVLISRAEVTAGLAKAHRMGLVDEEAARSAHAAFQEEWPQIAHVAVNEGLVARADALAWDHDLRGYDSVHLAAALLWQEAIGLPVVMATFDARLWRAARSAGVQVWPGDLTAYQDSP